MLKQSERFQFLAHQFNSLVERYNEAPTPGLEQRTKLLRGMKVVIVEIDMLVLSALRRDSQEVSTPPPPDQFAADA